MSTSAAYLLVEGKNDRHVIWALCNRHQIPDLFTVETPGTDEGIDALLQGIYLRLRAENLQVLGIVVDADQELSTRWATIKNQLRSQGYTEIPVSPPENGWISSTPGLPRVGVWLMPNNTLPGMLENFVTELIPNNDILLPKAEKVLQEIEQSNQNRYPITHHPKALIHTWLAWQEFPGMPMGQAITARALTHESNLSNLFVAWIKRLFQLPSNE
jgi:hypothetical protein